MQLVGTVTSLHSAEVREHVLDALNSILFPENHDSGTALPALYGTVRQLIEKNAQNGNGMSPEEVSALAGWSPRTGAQPPATCAQVRWNTTQISNEAVHLSDDALAAGLICSKAYARTEADHAAATASPFTSRGFVATDHPNVGTTEAIGQVIKVLTAPQAKAQRAMVSAIYKLVTRPLIVVTNDTTGGRARLMGPGGVIRRLLRALQDAIWLSTGTRERKHALAHRTH